MRHDSKPECRITEFPRGERLAFDLIPVVDLEPWFLGDYAKKRALAAAVHEACREIGFLYIFNHGVSQGVVDNAFRQAQRFFSLTDGEKRQVHYAKSGRHRGYIPYREERTDANAKGDLKEAFDYGLEVPSDSFEGLVAQRMSAPNLFPLGMADFREAIETYFSAMMQLGGTLFQIFAVGFELSPDYFNDEITKPIAQMRLLHYPPQSNYLQGEFGIGEHSDYECFTILAQDEIGGLQVRNRTGAWGEARPMSGAFVVNIGEMLMRWTNDHFVSTPHRVVNTSARERYSLAFFFATNYDTIISCLPSCEGPDRPLRYPPITAGEYLAQRLKEIYDV